MSVHYVPKERKKSHNRSISKSKSLSSLPSLPPEPSQDAEKRNSKEKRDSKYDKILNAIQNEEFQDVDISATKTQKQPNDQQFTDHDLAEFRRLHNNLTTRNLSHRSSAGNLRLASHNGSSQTSLVSTPLTIPKRISDSPSLGGLSGLVSSNSSVSSLTNNASYVRGLGINKNQVRRPSDNLQILKNTSQIFDDKSDISSGLDSVSEDYQRDHLAAFAGGPSSQASAAPAAQTAHKQSLPNKQFLKSKPPRPFSDDSMASCASSSFEFESEYDSRISSLTSVENSISSPENENALYHERTPKMAETPEFIKRDEIFKFDDFSPEAASRIDDLEIDTSTANNSTTTINSSSTVKEIAQGEEEEGDVTDIQTRQNTRINSISSPNPVSPLSVTSPLGEVLPKNYVNSPNAMSAPRLPPNRNRLNRVASLPALRMSDSRSSLGLGLNSAANTSSMTLDSIISSNSVNGTPIIGSNGQVIVSPSQKFRLKRQLSRKNLANFQKQVSRINVKDELVDIDDTVSDSIFFNIPYATGSAASVFTSTAGNKSKRAMSQSQVSLAISPLVNDTKNTLNDHEFANNLSKFYSETSENFVADELSKREENQYKLPSYIINQIETQSSIYSQSSFSPGSESSFESRNSMSLGSPLSEELRMMSPEKIDSLSSTRPMWLPPKSPLEDSKHQQQIVENFETYSKKEIGRKERNFQRLKNSLVNSQKWFEITVKHPEIHKPVIYSMRHLCWKTNIPNELRFKVWSRVLNYYEQKRWTSEVDIEGESEAKKEPVKETYENLMSRLEAINVEYLEPEIDLIAESLFPRLGYFQNGQELNGHLKKLLLCKKISNAGLNYGDEVLIALFLLYFPPRETFELVNLIDTNVLNDTLKSKFNKNLSTNYTMKRYLEKHFKDEMVHINHRNLCKIFMKINPELMIKIFDFLVLNNSYKICYCFMLLVLKFYHFGFVDLGKLVVDDTMFIDVDDTDEFLERFHYYYKKF